MRITFVAPIADLSGGFRVIVTLAERLGRLGHDVTLVSTPPRRATLREWARLLMHRRPLPSATRKSPHHAQGADVWHRVVPRHRVSRGANVPDADVVVATWWETAEWVASYPPCKGAKVYFLQHYEAFPNQPADRVARTWRLPMHKIVSSQWLADVARQRFGDAGATVVPSSADTRLFHALPRGKRPTPTVGVLYSTAAFKGCDVSLAAFELARRRVPRLRLVSFGCSAPSRGLPLPAATQFHCRPPQHRIRDLYAACDAWLFGSRSEGFGLPLVEAMACRTPVVATPAGASPQLLRDGGGLLVLPEDPAAMAAAIEWVCGMSDTQWRAASDAAYRAATSYTWDDAARLFEAALRNATRRVGVHDAKAEGAPGTVGPEASLATT